MSVLYDALSVTMRGLRSFLRASATRFAGDLNEPRVKKKKKKKTDQTSRRTQAGIGHSAPAHRGGHMQNRISRRQVHRGKIEHSAEAEQPRTD